MKLSTAMMLGSTTCKMIPRDWNSCALGAAANAVGIEKVCENLFFQHSRIPKIFNYWPWLREGTVVSIYTLFDTQVCTGKMTYETLVDYVRSIEPECGECNSRECACQKPETQTEKEVVYETK